MSALADAPARSAAVPRGSIGGVFWLEQALAADPGPGCPPLAGVAHADVCVVGGGYVGLWTALELARRAPDARIVLLEAEGCGFGASGRNGGWATSWNDELDLLGARFGRDGAIRLAEQSTRAIDWIEEACEAEGIDCGLRRRGALWAAGTDAQREALAMAECAARSLGRESYVQRVGAAELRALTGAECLQGALRFPEGAALQPALLARGLRRVALRRGVRIHEGSPVIRIGRGAPAAVHTRAGRVDAEKVVIATGAWAAQVRELRRAIVPVGSHIVLTEPVPELLERLGWTGGELLGDAGLLVHYAQVTAGGRIAFGRGGGAIGSRGRVVPAHFVDPRSADSVVASLRRWFPQLDGVRITHAWGGAVDRAPGHLPFAGSLGPHGNIHYGVGFSGNGVAPSALFGRILAALALGDRDEYSSSPLVSGPPGYLPVEPIRSLAGAAVRLAVERSEAAEAEGRRPGVVARSLRPLASFTLPRALEPRLWRNGSG